MTQAPSSFCQPLTLDRRLARAHPPNGFVQRTHSDSLPDRLHRTTVLAFLSTTVSQLSVDSCDSTFVASCASLPYYFRLLTSYINPAPILTLCLCRLPERAPACLFPAQHRHRPSFAARRLLHWDSSTSLRTNLNPHFQLNQPWRLLHWQLRRELSVIAMEER